MQTFINLYHLFLLNFPLIDSIFIEVKKIHEDQYRSLVSIDLKGSLICTDMDQWILTHNQSATNLFECQAWQYFRYNREYYKTRQPGITEQARLSIQKPSVKA